MGYFFTAVGTGLLWSPDWTVKKVYRTDITAQGGVAWHLCGAFQVGGYFAQRICD
jgi:hypothetical protein